MVARIAAARLTPAAEAAVRGLLGPGFTAESDMVHVASWADWQGRARPETKPWHYVDIEIGETGYDAGRDCAGGNCVVTQILRDEAVLADPARPRAERAEALRWLIHLVGDLHQPLHCADDHDRGGNGVAVTIGDDDTNLHRVWDSDEIAVLDEDPARLAATLGGRITARRAQAWAQGTAADWANESFAIARTRIYPRVHRGEVSLSVQDLRHDAPLAARQLEKAGVRLAYLLNGALSSP